MTKTSILTGIQASGQLHLGNYLGTVQPALTKAGQYESAYYFIADYHALNSVTDPKLLRQQTLYVAAAWLASGLDPDKITFYRQSDIPEDFELSVILNAITPKGWMNKSHAYKAVVDQNTATGKPVDADVNMGLYTYPVLMASDIIVMNASIVPVGKDQVQHVEIARDIAQRFNAQYQTDVLALPQYELEEGVSILPGTDGRKMSKSYGNIIPLYATKDEWWAAIQKTQTSTEMDEQNITNSPLMQIFAALSKSNGDDTYNALKSELMSGTKQWKDAKEALLEQVSAMFSQKAEVYLNLLEKPEEVEQVLAQGAQKARTQAQEVLALVKKTIGISA